MEEVGQCLADGQHIQRHDAGGRDAGNVLGDGTVGRAHHVNGQVSRVDQAVAPQAAGSGQHEPGGGVDLPDDTLIDRDLHTDLGGRNEVLLDGDVGPVPGGGSVGGQEDPVALGQLVPGARVLDTLIQDGQADPGLGAARQPYGDFSLGAADVALVGAGQAREVALLHGVVVDQDQVAHAQAGQALARRVPAPPRPTIATFIPWKACRPTSPKSSS